MNPARKAKLLRKFQESDHPRDRAGRFTEKSSVAVFGEGGGERPRNPFYGRFHSTGPSTSFRQEIDHGPKRSSGQVSSLYGKARVTDEGRRRLESGIARAEGKLAAAERLHAARGDEKTLAERDKHQAKLESLKDAKLVSDAPEAAPDDKGGAFFRMKPQVPEGMGVATYTSLMQRANAGVRALRQPVQDKARERGLLPADADPKVVRRATNVAHGLALRSLGPIGYDYSFGPDKEAMKAYEPYIRYAANRFVDHLRAAHKGAWGQFKEGFGKPLIDKKTGKQKIHPVTGRPRFVLPGHRSDLIKLEKSSRVLDPDADSRLTQPAQLAAGSIASAVAGYKAAEYAGKKLKPATDRFGRRMGARFRLASKSPYKTAPVGYAKYGHDIASAALRRQSHAISRFSGMGARGAAAATAGAAAAGIADYGGDYVARRVTGAKGENDQYRNLSILGAVGALAGGGAGEMIARNARRIRRIGGRTRAGAAILGATVGGAGAELLGNFYDKKYSVTPNVINARKADSPAAQALELRKFLPALMTGLNAASNAATLYSAGKTALGWLGRAGSTASGVASRALPAARLAGDMGRQAVRSTFTQAGVRATARSNYRQALGARLPAARSAARTWSAIGDKATAGRAFSRTLAGNPAGRALRRFKATPLQGTLAGRKATGIGLGLTAASMLPAWKPESKPIY